MTLTKVIMNKVLKFIASTSNLGLIFKNVRLQLIVKLTLFSIFIQKARLASRNWCNLCQTSNVTKHKRIWNCNRIRAIWMIRHNVESIDIQLDYNVTIFISLLTSIKQNHFEANDIFLTFSIRISDKLLLSANDVIWSAISMENSL